MTTASPEPVITFIDGLPQGAWADGYALHVQKLDAPRIDSYQTVCEVSYQGDYVKTIAVDLLKSRSCEDFIVAMAGRNGVPPIEWEKRLDHFYRNIQAAQAAGEVAPPVIPPGIVPVKPFPLEVLPAPLRSLVTEGAQGLSVAPDLIAVHVLTIAGAALGPSRALQLNPQWTEWARLYSAVVAEPGSLKSPAFKLAFDPVEAKGSALKDAYTAADERYAFDLSTYEAEMHAYKRQKKGLPPVKPHEPTQHQVYTTDTTVEALTAVLEHNPYGLLYAHDELTSWVRSLNQYKGGKGGDRQQWLRFWSGASIVVNRKHLKAPLHIDNPFVSVTGCVPPDVLADLNDERGRDDGFVHRILFAFPDPRPIEVSQTWVTDETRGAYAALLATLWSYDPRAPVTRHFSAAGAREWTAWLQSHYDELNGMDLEENLRGPWGKMQGYCARLALILHECGLACDPKKSQAITAETIAAAAALIEYFKSHARRVYARLHNSPLDQRLERALRWLAKRGGTATYRDLLTAKVGNVHSAAEAEALAQSLHGRGLVTLTTEYPPSGGHAVTRLHLADALRTNSAEGSTE
jgi:hypothetical protein